MHNGDKCKWVGPEMRVGPRPGTIAMLPGDTCIVVNSAVHGSKDVVMVRNERTGSWFGWTDAVNVEVIQPATVI